MGYKIEDGVLRKYYPKKGTKKATIPQGVTSIGDGAFSRCSELTSIVIPDSVTSIEFAAFSGCEALTSIPLPDGVTSIGASAFYGCKALTSISLPDGVTSIGQGAFSQCTSLTDITIPDGVESIESFTFDGCESLVNITIPDSVRSMGDYAFYGCKGLTSVALPDHCETLGCFLFPESTAVLVEGRAIPFVNGDVSYEKQLSVIRHKDYNARMSTKIKYPLMWKLYFQDPDDPELFAWVKKHFSNMFKFLIEKEDVTAVNAICESERFLNKKNIDNLIEAAIEHTRKGGSPEIQIILTDYKYEKLGFKKDAFGSFKL